MYGSECWTTKLDSFSLLNSVRVAVILFNADGLYDGKWYSRVDLSQVVRVIFYNTTCIG